MHTGSHGFYDIQVVVVNIRHETVNRQFKIFGVISQCLRHPLEKYDMVLQVIARHNIFQVECTEQTLFFSQESDLSP